MILFRADRLIDGTGAPALEGAAVIVEGDRILDAGRAADIGIPLGALIIDAPAGGTLMPGLIDVHVHLAYCGSKDSNAFRAESATMEYPAIALRAVRFARDTLRHGYTSVRDMHAPGGTIIDLRDAVNAGLVEGPRILAPGLGLTVTGGHMDQPGFADHMTFQRGLRWPGGIPSRGAQTTYARCRLYQAQPLCQQPARRTSLPFRNGGGRDPGGL
jgi:imidazolonepropionase-like amidohydrolase